MAWVVLIAALFLLVISALYFMGAGVSIAKFDKPGRQIALWLAISLGVVAAALLFGAGLIMGGA